MKEVIERILQEEQDSKKKIEQAKQQAERIVSEARAQACKILEESAEQSRVSALERQKAVRAEYLAEKESMLNGAREEYAALRKAKEKNVPSAARKIFSEIISL